MIRTAVFSTDRLYRYTLGRSWRDEPVFTAPPSWDQDTVWIMLNPSQADEYGEDPTVAKCLRLSRRWGYGGAQVRNLFALVSTDPTALKSVRDPVGPDNDDAIREAVLAPSTGLIVAAWGNHGRYQGRSREVRCLLAHIGRPVHCLAVSQQGEPVHPLYERECRFEELRDWM